MGLAAELDESPVVDDAVDHGGGHPVVPEHRPPPAEPQVRGDYHRLRLVGVGEGPEEWPRPVRGGREKPELVDDGQAGPADERGPPSSRARLGRITGEDAAKRRASSPLSHAGAQRADATRVLPVPTSPMGAGSDSRPMPSGHDAADQSWPSKVLGAGSAQRLSGAARLEVARQVLHLPRGAGPRPLLQDDSQHADGFRHRCEGP